MYPGERFNGLTHLSGALLALAGTVVLVVLASLKADPWKIASFSIDAWRRFAHAIVSRL